MKMNKDLYVGISIHFAEKGVNNIFANGAIQNVIFLYLLLKKIPFVKKISLVYLGDRTTPHPDLRLDGLGIQYEFLDDVADKLDLLIEGTVMLEARHADAVHKNNGKVVSYRMGNDYILEMESFIFNREFGRFFNGVEVDAVWTIPQHEKTCKSYFGIMSRAPVVVLPHIWMPLFFDKSIEELKQNNIHFGYKADFSESKRISNFEPNTSVIKTCYIPILMCEQAYRTKKNLIKHVYLCNTVDKKDRTSFHNFIGRTDLVRDNVMTVEGRFLVSDFLARYTDIVIAHQWENALNYSYYEALYGGYPLLHNSKLLPMGVGYYYDEFNAEQGAEILLSVIKHHDVVHDTYVNTSQSFLKTLSIYYPVNMEAHTKAIIDLMQDKV